MRSVRGGPVSRVRRFTENTAGVDYIVGDIHGCFSKLADALGEIGFDPDAGDRLFSVGDLVDRGPESELAINWLDQPWFFAVAGNHEDYAIRWPNGFMDRENYIANGGAWNVLAGPDASENYSYVLGKLPVAIELETSAGLVGIVHADCPLSDWHDFVSELDSPNCRRNIPDMAQWSRGRIERSREGFQHQDVTGVRAVVVGHTPLPDIAWVGNVLHIDTGACFHWGKFSIVRADTLGLAK